MAVLSDRLKWRGPFILICLPLAIAGLSITLLLRISNKGRSISGYILAIAAKTNAARYGAVFLMAAGVFVSIFVFTKLEHTDSDHQLPIWSLHLVSYSLWRFLTLFPCEPRSILPNNSSGHYKKATTTALQLAIANTGLVTPFSSLLVVPMLLVISGFVATFAYTSDQAPRYVRGHSIALGKCGQNRE